MFHERFGIPVTILNNVPTHTPAGQDARKLMELFLAVPDDGRDKFDPETTCFDNPDGLWSENSSDLSDLILNRPSDPRIAEAYAQSQQRKDEVARILNEVLGPFNVVAVNSKTWAFTVFGRPSCWLSSGQGARENFVYTVHQQQMRRLGLFR